MRRRLVAALLLLLPLAARAQAQTQAPAGRVEIVGQVQLPASLTIEALAALPAIELQAPREGGAVATYVGTLLWPILTAANPIDAPGRATHLQHVLVARGADGYAVAVAIGEIDPGFEGKPVVIAYKQDGAALAAPRLVVPGDHRPGRFVRELVAIEVQ